MNVLYLLFVGWIAAMTTPVVADAPVPNVVLLVRLPAQTQVIDALEARRQTARAAAVRNERDEKNATWMNAFRTQFDFCPVYFFYADDSPRVRDQAWGEVAFLDGTPGLDTLEAARILTAEVRARRAAHNAGNAHTPSSSDATFEALRLMDHQFQPMPHPAPRRVRIFKNFLPFRRKPEEIVSMLNTLVAQWWRQQ
ncbi:MAG: hypothetical protein WBA12_06155 [Catalinimonas sp.]